MEFISHVDSTIWVTYLSVLKQIGLGFSKAVSTLKILEDKNDKRGLHIAIIELKIYDPILFPDSISELLIGFCSNFLSKPSTLNDVIYFLKKIGVSDKRMFYFQISDQINTVN
jgi:hypothetical protein